MGKIAGFLTSAFFYPIAIAKSR